MSKRNGEIASNASECRSGNIGKLTDYATCDSSLGDICKSMICKPVRKDRGWGASYTECGTDMQCMSQNCGSDYRCRQNVKLE